MKQIIQLTLLTALVAFAAACKNTDQTDTATATQGAPMKSAQGSAAPPHPPGTSQFEVLLQQNYWVWEKYYVDDPEARKFNRGRWYKFKPDGSFESGHWQEDGAPGSWLVYQNGGKTFLALDSVNDAEDLEFQLQTNQAETEIAWTGTPKYEYNSTTMLLSINLLTKPTKEQFHVVD
ncbi:MAG: hypothetical protein H6562_20100 [Lewinellaceae bacterium]|nr:hypothetical protein [Lewinella sp.]MCB9281201.1 hypothetical protein [Lewinellaceae bacterium]